MKHWLIWGGILFGAFILQCTLLPLLAYHGIHADLLLIIVVLASLHLGRRQGTMIGFSAGLLQDLYSGTFFGMNTFAKLLVAYLFGLAEQQVFKENLFLPLMATAIATVGSYFIGAFIMILLGYRFDLLENMANMLVPLLIYNVVFSLPVHRLMAKMGALTKASS